MEALKAKLLQKLETAAMDHKRYKTSMFVLDNGACSIYLANNFDQLFPLCRFDSTLEAMLPYIDVKGLRELPLTLLGRYPDRMSKDIIEKIGSDQELFKVILSRYHL
jgi:hypothetical protein